MQVRTVVQTDEGFVKFEGELSPQEAEYVVGIGLNVLLQQGALKGNEAPAEENGDFVQ